jgi:phosphoserine phosphatase RsbU/P
VARFAAEAGLALAGTLNLRRTLGHVVTLSVPRLGDWCAVVIPDGQLHRVVSCGLATGVPMDRTVELGSEHAIRPGLQPPDPALLRALGVDAAAVEQIVGGEPADVLTVPLQAHGTTAGFLLVARPREDVRPNLDAMTQELARRSALAIAAARIYEERAALAGTLRAALLPPDLPEVPGVELGARYRAAQEATQIGGDFYQVYRCDSDGWAFEIGDVCGKGVNAAVLTGQVRQSLRTAALVESDPARILTVLNDTMLAVDGSKFVSLVHGRLQRRDDGALTIDLAGGGHPHPLLLRTDGTVESVEAPGMIVGMLREARFRTVTLTLAAGETLLLYTDGVTEARVGGEQLGVNRLAAMLRDCRGMSAQAIAERLEQLVLDYLNGRPHDDIALLALRAEAARD